MRLHHITYRYIIQHFLNDNIFVAGCCGIIQKPTNKDQPDAVEQASTKDGETYAEGHPQTAQDHRPADRLSQKGSPTCSDSQIAGNRPEQRTNNPATIQWECRNQVKE